MDITRISNNRLSFNKIHCYLLFLFIFISNFSYGQIHDKSVDENIKRFNDFIKLFYSIPDNDSTPVWQPIEYTTCPHTIIDSDYCSVVNFIPYFYPYAIFKVERLNGILVCVQYVCPAELADLQFVEFITFDTLGVLRNKIALPYRKNGCLADAFEDISQIYVSKDKLQVIVERVFYGKSGSEKISNSVYEIDVNGVPILVSD